MVDNIDMTQYVALIKKTKVDIKFLILRTKDIFVFRNTKNQTQRTFSFVSNSSYFQYSKSIMSNRKARIVKCLICRALQITSCIYFVCVFCVLVFFGDGGDGELELRSERKGVSRHFSDKKKIMLLIGEFTEVE